MAEALSKRGAKVTGADPSEAAIAAAGCHAEANDLEIAVCSNFCRIGRLLLGPPQRAERSALPGDPVDQARGIQQRCCLIEELLDVESYQDPSHESPHRRRHRRRVLFPRPYQAGYGSQLSMT